jgi:hypothetical protein
LRSRRCSTASDLQQSWRIHSRARTELGQPSRRRDLVKAVVSIKPRTCMLTDADLQRVFTRVPLLTMFGGFFGTDVGDWPGRMAECVDTVNRIKAARGTAENIHLPASGIHGNSHMLMMETNNQQIADIILAWLGRAARAS